MFRSTSRVFARVVRAGRIKHSFAIAVVVALFALPVTEALAFYSASGTGTTDAIAGSPNATVTITTGTARTYAGPSTTNLMPGGTVTFGTNIACTANCPAFVGSINLGSWTSDKAGCDTATLPGSFTMPAIVVNASFTAAGGAGPNGTITWVNLATLSQNACAGAHFTFNLVTP